MGVSLFDPVTRTFIFDINFWHWGAIVGSIDRLGVLSPEAVDGLTQYFAGELSAEEARNVAAALRERVLPTMTADERMMLDGSFTQTPDDGVFHKAPQTQALNYSTTREVMELFIIACETCNGFKVW